jgi:hypothetical protein
MSSRKVTPLVRTLTIVNSTYQPTFGNTLIDVLETHYLTTGDLITVRFLNVPQIFENVPVTVTSGTAFTIDTPYDCKIDSRGEIKVRFYSTGMTGTQSPITVNSTTALAAVMQLWTSGTGGAVYTVEGSLDGIHFNTDSNITTHLGVNGDTQAVVITVSWAYLRLNITSIGAATKLYGNFCG